MSGEENVFDGLGIRVKLKKKDDFLLVCETLTRIGIASRKDNKLYQSCHLLHKRGEYAIMHFKEMFVLDGYNDIEDVPEEDIKRRNRIAKLLSEWNLVELIDEIAEDDMISMSRIKILPYKDKADWTLVPKYSIGNSNKTTQAE